MIRLWIIRFLFLIGLVIAFQVVLKPVRLFLVHDLLVSIAQSVQSSPSDFNLLLSRSVGFNVTDASNPDQNPSEWFGYTGFGNLYFLIGSAILILLGYDWKKIAWLLALHAILSILAGLFLVVGLWTNTIYWLYAMDFTVSKAYPAATGMFVLMQRGT